MKSLSLWLGSNMEAQRQQGRGFGRLKAFLFGFLGFVSFLSLNSFLLLAQPLSPSAQVSLITVGPGEELYSSFGHSALRFSDPQQGVDKVYNYGTFDFRTDNFYVKFLRGTLPYQLSVAPMYYTLYGAQAENREVIEQVLDLSPTQKQRLYDFLENNYLPQNRQYQYKFFYDNCSTRLRDALMAACGDSLRFSTISVSHDSTFKSYRAWMNDYLTFKEWEAFGMNLAIGLPANETADVMGEMYLPYNLKDHFDRATLGGKPLVKQKVFLLLPSDPTHNSSNWYNYLFAPHFVFLCLGILVFYLNNKQKKIHWIDKLLFSILGIAGWILLLLWVATDHGVTAYNVNLLWAMPLHFPLFFVVYKNTFWLKRYIMVCLGLIIMLMIIVMFSHIKIPITDKILPEGLWLFLCAIIVRFTTLAKS
ncbi:MAG: DUF4105 domain-containing protein [Runella sp.]